MSARIYVILSQISAETRENCLLRRARSCCLRYALSSLRCDDEAPRGERCRNMPTLACVPIPRAGGRWLIHKRQHGSIKACVRYQDIWRAAYSAFHTPAPSRRDDAPPISAFRRFTSAAFIASPWLPAYLYHFSTPQDKTTTHFNR